MFIPAHGSIDINPNTGTTQMEQLEIWRTRYSE
jgi:hypothetical protein